MIEQAVRLFEDIEQRRRELDHIQDPEIRNMHILSGVKNA